MPNINPEDVTRGLSVVLGFLSDKPREGILEQLIGVVREATAESAPQAKTAPKAEEAPRAKTAPKTSPDAAATARLLNAIFGQDMHDMDELVAMYSNSVGAILREEIEGYDLAEAHKVALQIIYDEGIQEGRRQYRSEV